MEDKKKRAMLVILDGWGLGKEYEGNAVALAKTPFFDEVYKNNPHSKLEASGNAVGLPEGQMGNSEVGHMNIGAGRVVYQQLVRISKSIEDKTLYQNPALLKIVDYVKKNNKKLHLLGLASSGGVHSHLKHLYALLDFFEQHKLDKVFVHAFTDGRDTNTHEGQHFIKELQDKVRNSHAKIASIVGRYYAMDRDNRWERIKKAYDLLVHGVGDKFTDPVEAVQQSYKDEVTDEFILPKVIVDGDNKPIAQIEEGDAVLCFNYRTDRGRQITKALSQQDIAEAGLKKLNLFYSTLTCYDEAFKGVNVVFDEIVINNGLGETLSKHGKTQLRVAETEKYPHVTFFFNGGLEVPFEGEDRMMINSPKVATYDLQPEMSAREVTEKLIARMEADLPDFICLNFANPDMVGHTGVLEAEIKALETVDECFQKVMTIATKLGYQSIVIADHGNAEYMINEDGTPNTYHTTNLVPCILLNSEHKSIQDGKLGDIAPTILNLMGLPVPEEMTGNSLL